MSTRHVREGGGTTEAAGEEPVMRGRLAWGLGLVLAGCTPADELPELPDLPALALALVHAGLDTPVDLQAPADGSGRVFIVEKPGRIRISRGGVLQEADDAFLDIAGLVESGGMEQGLLGLAFHPDYAGNGRFFVNYTRAGDAGAESVVAQYRVADDSDHADPVSATIIVRFDQPFGNHNGGQLQFGPDGMLYVGAGDGGSACDPGDRAQDPAALLGKMLRLDVDRPPDFAAADNPFVGDGSGRDLIWAVGLRNPWRFSFDSLTGLLYIADVGQNRREEIDVVAVDPGQSPDFGWRTFEGTVTSCAASGFDTSNSLVPQVEYSHAEGCSITGGYVYRGSTIPALDGLYFYSDFCTGFLRVVRFADGAVVLNADITGQVDQPDGSLDSTTSFGLDGRGELYVLDLDGDVFRLVLGR